MADCFSNTNVKDIAKILKVLGNPLRLEILMAIYTKKCKVAGLVDCLNEPQPIVSQQLAILRKAGIITGEKQKNVIIYKIIEPITEKMISQISLDCWKGDFEG